MGRIVGWLLRAFGRSSRRHPKWTAAIVIFLILLIIGEVEDAQTPKATLVPTATAISALPRATASRLAAALPAVMHPSTKKDPPAEHPAYGAGVPVSRHITLILTPAPQVTATTALSATPLPSATSVPPSATPKPTEVHAVAQETAMAAVGQDGYDAISTKVAGQCGITPDQVFGLLEPIVQRLNDAGIVQDRLITLEGVSHVLPTLNLNSSTFCQDGFRTYLTLRLKEVTAAEPILPPLGKHHLSIKLNLQQVYLGNYDSARVTTEVGIVCKASLYYTDGTESPKSTWADPNPPQTQTMGDQPMMWMWEEDSPAYGGDFVVLCSRRGRSYAAKAPFDILPVYWPQ